MTAVDVLESRTPLSRTGANGHAIQPDVATGDLAMRIAATAAIARANAATVDRDGCFPQDAITSARAERLMGIMVPRALGGEGATIGEVADVCYRLGQGCASTAMIYAMHQIKAACLVRHGRQRPVAPAPAPPHRRRAASACLVDDGRQGRRQRALQCGGDRARRLGDQPRAERDGDFLRRLGRRHRDDGAPLR